MVIRIGWLSLGLLAALSATTAASAQNTPNPAVQAACRDDAQRLCHGIQPGGGRIGQCLKQRIAEVSPRCLDAVKASRQGGQHPR